MLKVRNGGDSQIPPALLVDQVSKSFGSVQVLRDISLSIRPGEVHGLVGQNGAGKSTLINILGGVYPDHAGQILLRGEPVVLGSPRESQRMGIGIIHQELSLIPELTVAENIVLGSEPGRMLHHQKKVLGAARKVVASSVLLRDLPLQTRVADLSVGRQQMVEVAKALSTDATLLVLDEPTVRLSGPERSDLHALVQELAGQGRAVLYVSHFLDDVIGYTDRVTVLRNGRVVAQGETHSFKQETLVEALLGRELLFEEFHSSKDSNENHMSRLEVEHLSVHDGISDVSFTMQAGSILGIAGLLGSGRTQLARALSGATKTSSGAIKLDGSAIRLRSPHDAVRCGIVHLAEDRKRDGIIAMLSARANIALIALGTLSSKLGWLSSKKLRKATDSLFEDLHVAPSRPSMQAGNFSGGNQQKLLLGRVMLAQPKVIICDEPTAGVDVGAKAQIHRLLVDAASSGISVIVISDDIDELLALSDRVMLMERGRVKAVRARVELEREDLVRAIAGASTEGVVA